MKSHYQAEFKDGHSEIPILDQICTGLSLPVRWINFEYRRSNFLEPLEGFHFEVEAERIEYTNPRCEEPKTLRLLVSCGMVRFKDEPSFRLVVKQLLHVNDAGILVGLSDNELTDWLLGQNRRSKKTRGVIMGQFREALGAKLSESLTGALDTLSIPEVTR